MKIPYYFGWVLLAAGFASASAEVLVRPLKGANQVIVAAQDLWYAIWPGGLLVFQIRVERISPELWDTWALAILSVPAWALFGIPGFLCVGLFRPRKPNDWRELEEARRYEQQLALYDTLAQEARSEGIEEDGNADGYDRLPDHSVLEAFEAAEEEPIGDESTFDEIVRAAGVEPRVKPVATAPEVRLENLSGKNPQGPSEPSS